MALIDIYGTENGEYILLPNGGINLRALGGNDTVVSGPGEDSLDGGAGDDNIDGGGGNDTLIGGDGNDTLSGGAGDDVLLGGAGSNVLNGGDGNDRVVFENWDTTATNTIDGGAGNDTVDFSNYPYVQVVFNPTLEMNIENVIGSIGADKINATGMNMAQAGIDISGGGGNDTLTGGQGNDTLDGGSGNDLLIGGQGHNLLIGGAGLDTLRGDNGNDTLQGGDGADEITPGAGRNVVQGGAGNDNIFYNGEWGQNPETDTIDGGDGFDTVFLTWSGTQTFNLTPEKNVEYIRGSQWASELLDGSTMQTGISLNGQGGADTLRGGAGGDTLYGGDGNDMVYGNDGNDIVVGDAGNDTLYGGAGNDGLYGYEGDDILYGGTGVNFMNGGIGNDQLWDEGGESTMNGEAGDDNFFITDRFFGIAGYSNDSISGGAGYDSVHMMYSQQSTSSKFNDANGIERVFGGVKGDTIDARAMTLEVAMYGDTGNDGLFGGSAGDYLCGEAGDDTLEGNGGNDFLLGGDDNDLLIGGAGADVLHGGTGNDVLNGGVGADMMYGGEGDDYFLLTGNQLWSDDTIEGEAGFDIVSLQTDVAQVVQLTAAHQVERVEGSNKADDISAKGLETKVELWGGGGNDTLAGGNGADKLEGDDGNDYLLGHGGDDTLWGGAGSDTLGGGAGDDVFVMRGETGNWLVTDFARGSDKVEVVTFPTPGTQPVDFAYMQQHMTQVGADTRIAIGESFMTLTGVQASTLTETDFIFTVGSNTFPFPW
ncbi:MAG TPA: calcium-binding protein [Burkholderiaceae bacterium]